MPSDSPEGAVRCVALGTVQLEQVLPALPRTVRQEASARCLELRR